jgi:hypothetical protein
MGTLQDLRKAYPEYTIVDEAEEERLEAIRMYVAELPVRIYLLTCTKAQSEREGTSKEEEDCRRYA